jgi:hypothetical protein
VATWWPTGKPQQQPEQCGQLQSENEMVLLEQRGRVINSMRLCKLPQLHSTRLECVLSTKHLPGHRILPRCPSPADRWAELPLRGETHCSSQHCVYKAPTDVLSEESYASNVLCIVSVPTSKSWFHSELTTTYNC